MANLQPVSSSKSILAVAMLTRHGSRAPTITYPNDPHADYKWPSGFGTLTPKGIRELHKSGLIKAKRYEPLLRNTPNNVFGPKNFYVRSSAVNRCIVSAECMLDGLAPSIYEKIPIDIPEPSQDTMLTWPGKLCIRYIDELKKAIGLDNPGLLEITENGKIVDYMLNQTGAEYTNVFELATLSDAILVQKEHGLILPSWAEEISNPYFQQIIDYALTTISLSKAMQMKVGALLNDIIERFDACLSKSEDAKPPNILLYSGHDINLVAFMHLLEIYNQINSRPSYGATIALELYRQEGTLDEVEIVAHYYRNYGDEDPQILNIPGCSSPCLYDMFKSRMQSKMVSDFDENCANKL